LFRDLRGRWGARGGGWGRVVEGPRIKKGEMGQPPLRQYTARARCPRGQAVVGSNAGESGYPSDKAGLSSEAGICVTTIKAVKSREETKWETIARLLREK